MESQPTRKSSPGSRRASGPARSASEPAHDATEPAHDANGPGRGPTEAANVATEPAAATSEAGHGAEAALEPIDLDERAELMNALVAMFKQIGWMRAHLQPSELEMSTSFLVHKIAEAGAIRVTDLASTICADPSTISRQVAQVVKSGLIERRPDPADGRASLLALTDAGQDWLVEHRRTGARIFRQLLGGWSRRDQHEFTRLLLKFNEDIASQRDSILTTLRGRFDRSL